MIRASKDLPLVIQGGNQTFDFTHINDVTKGILAAIELLIKQAAEEDPIFDDLHIVTGKATSLQELTELLNEIFANEINVKFAPKRHYDVERFYGDPTKCKEILGFKTNIDIEEGIKLLAEELKDHLNSKNNLRL